jgi:hypothetical protein
MGRDIALSVDTRLRQALCTSLPWMDQPFQRERRAAWLQRLPRQPSIALESISKLWHHNGQSSYYYLDDLEPRVPLTTFLTRQVAGKSCDGATPQISTPFYPMFYCTYQATSNLSGELFAVVAAGYVPLLHVSTSKRTLPHG